MNLDLSLDWYTASVPAPPDELVDTMLKHFDQAVLDSIEPRRRYDHGIAIHAGYDNTKLCEIHWGRNYDSPLWQATGSATILSAPALRRWYPKHNVTRLDAALDVYDSGLDFATDVLPAARSIIEDRRMRSRLDGDWINPENGRTIELGSRKSATYCRVYEKGPEQGIDADWIRIEVQHRPHSKMKRAASSLQAKTLLASFPAAAELAHALNIPVPEADTASLSRPRTPTDDDRKLRYLAHQYGDFLRRLLERHNGDAGSAYAEVLDAADALAQRRQERSGAARPERAQPPI